MWERRDGVPGSLLHMPFYQIHRAAQPEFSVDAVYGTFFDTLDMSLEGFRAVRTDF
jgi:hypothetical protein